MRYPIIEDSPARSLVICCNTHTSNLKQRKHSEPHRQLAPCVRWASTSTDALCVHTAAQCIPLSLVTCRTVQMRFRQSQLDARLLSRSQGFGSLPIEQDKLAVRALRHEVDAARQPLWLRVHCPFCPVRRKTWAQPVWDFYVGSRIRVSHVWPSLTSSHRALQNLTEPS